MHPDLLLVQKMSTNLKIVWSMFYHVRRVIYVMLKLLINLTIDDHCRVVLEGRPGDEGSDYINASFIDVSCNIISILYYIIINDHICMPSGLLSKRSLHCHSRPTTEHLWGLLENDLGKEDCFNNYAHQIDRKRNCKFNNTL